MPTTTGRASELITFSRGSLATVTDSDGKIKWAAHNLLTNSESFDVSSWISFAATVNANVTAAPNGTTTADKICEWNGTGAQTRYQTFTVGTAGSTFTLTVYAKKDERNFITVSLSDQPATGWIAATFNLDAVTVTKSQASGVSGYALVGTPSITAIGNGWCQCVLTGTLGTAGTNYCYVGPVTTGTPTYGNSGIVNSTGTAPNGIFVWGAHLYRSDLGGMQVNASAYPYYNSSTPKNLIGFSEAFTDAWWTKLSVTVAAQAAAGPTGMGSATLAYPTSTGTDRLVYRGTALTGAANTPYTISVYAKASGINFLYFGTLGGGTSPASTLAFFDLASGTKTQTGSYFTSATITPIGNGWYRCSATASVASASLFPVFGLADANNSTTVTASGTNGVLLWGAQLSDSASLDAYSPTFAAVTAAAAYHGPRLDYASDGSARGLLVEEQRTFLALNSNDFTSWTTINTAVTAADAVSPDGNTNATKLVFTGGVSANIYKNVAISNIAAHAVSFWIKGTAGQTLTPFAESVAGTYAASNPGTVTLTGSWQRVSWVHTPATGNNGVLVFIRSQSADTAKTVWVYGLAVEIGASGGAANFSTSYMPTAGSTVTRNADVASVGVSQFPYSSSASSLIVAFDVLAAGNPSPAMSIAALDNASNSQFLIYKNQSAATISLYMDNASALLGSVSANAVVKAAVAGDGNSNAGVLNGGSAMSLTSTLPAAAITMNIGSNGGLNRMSGHIRQITYIPRRLTNAELQARTA